MTPGDPGVPDPATDSSLSNKFTHIATSRSRYITPFGGLNDTSNTHIVELVSFKIRNSFVHTAE